MNTKIIVLLVTVSCYVIAQEAEVAQPIFVESEELVIDPSINMTPETAMDVTVDVTLEDVQSHEIAQDDNQNVQEELVDGELNVEEVSAVLEEMTSNEEDVQMNEDDFLSDVAQHCADVITEKPVISYTDYAQFAAYVIYVYAWKKPIEISSEYLKKLYTLVSQKLQYRKIKQYKKDETVAYQIR